MRDYLSRLQSRESALSPKFLNILASGFLEANGCVLLASEARTPTVARESSLDDTGYECFINHLHVKSLAEALAFARQLKSALTARFTEAFEVIVSFDGREATVRFHKNRIGQTWLSSDLEGYAEEGIAVLDSD